VLVLVISLTLTLIILSCLQIVRSITITARAQVERMGVREAERVRAMLRAVLRAIIAVRVVVTKKGLSFCVLLLFLYA
jgi:hypothetical protein